MKNYAQTLQILNNKTMTAGLLFLTSPMKDYSWQIIYSKNKIHKS